MGSATTTCLIFFFTTLEVTNTGPGFNRGSGGGARGCGFEERVGYMRVQGGFVSYSRFVCLCVPVTKWQFRSVEISYI